MVCFYAIPLFNFDNALNFTCNILDFLHEVKMRFLEMDGVIGLGDSHSGQSEVGYFLTDHLGSVRVIVGGSGKVLDRNDYYPFGARHVRSDYSQLAVNRCKY